MVSSAWHILSESNSNPTVRFTFHTFVLPVLTKLANRNCFATVHASSVETDSPTAQLSKIVYMSTFLKILIARCRIHMKKTTFSMTQFEGKRDSGSRKKNGCSLTHRKQWRGAWRYNNRHAQKLRDLLRGLLYICTYVVYILSANLIQALVKIHYNWNTINYNSYSTKNILKLSPRNKNKYW